MIFLTQMMCFFCVVEAADLSVSNAFLGKINQDVKNIPAIQSVDEGEEVLITYRQKLENSKEDYKLAVAGDPYRIFAEGFKQLRLVNLLPEIIGDFYLQEYYNHQLSCLIIRLDRERSTLTKTLAVKGFRISATKEAITALHVLAGVYELNFETETGYVEKTVQFFSQSKAAEPYFYGVFNQIKNRHDKQEMLEVGLRYLLQRYHYDRNFFNKILEWFGARTSQTRRAAEVLVSISDGLGVKLSEDYIKLLDEEDQKLLEEILEKALGK